MELNLRAIYHDEDTGKVLCFTHAVKAVMKGHVVIPEIDEFSGDGSDMRVNHCEKEGCPWWDRMVHI